MCIGAAAEDGARACWLESGASSWEGLAGVSVSGGEGPVHWPAHGGAATAASAAVAATSVASAACAEAESSNAAACTSVSAAKEAAASLDQAAEAGGRPSGDAKAAADGTDCLWGADTSGCCGVDGTDGGPSGTFLSNLDEPFADMITEADNLFRSLSEADNLFRSLSEVDDPFRSFHSDSADPWAGEVPAEDGEQTRLAVLPGEQASGFLFYLD